ncbi:hypothetical protein [Bacillus gobiensis]|uniref:hypothetical protein n=1 Tax=Bacillus gobiensis TaxID=1441095 RepID=UPI003D1B3531
MIQKKQSIENEFIKYNKLKLELLKTVQCIDCCQDKREEEIYQNISLEYSKELRNLKEFIEKEYQISLCNCCKF